MQQTSTYSLTSGAAIPLEPLLRTESRFFKVTVHRIKVVTCEYAPTSVPCAMGLATALSRVSALGPRPPGPSPFRRSGQSLYRDAVFYNFSIIWTVSCVRPCQAHSPFSRNIAFSQNRRASTVVHAHRGLSLARHMRCNYVPMPSVRVVCREQAVRPTKLLAFSKYHAGKCTPSISSKTIGSPPVASFRAWYSSNAATRVAL
mmetsp:Transcript_59595/g.132695  ORF Transcript_59595/g.132695 Transcript_59595/m.132695 type:complete len:202 (+) Transcript_59595:914-1519(+)